MKEVSGRRDGVVAPRINGERRVVPDTRDRATRSGRRRALRPHVGARRRRNAGGRARRGWLDDDDLVGLHVGEPHLASTREADDERSRLNGVSQPEVETWIL